MTRKLPKGDAVPGLTASSHNRVADDRGRSAATAWPDGAASSPLCDTTGRWG